MTAAQQSLYTAMQQHLCLTLAHYTVYLGTKLGLPIPSNKEQFVLEAAHSMGNKEGRFVWATTEEDHVEDEDDELLMDDYSKIDFDKWAFHLSEYYATGENFGTENQQSYDFHSARDFAGQSNFPFVNPTPELQMCDTFSWEVLRAEILNMQRSSSLPLLPFDVPQQGVCKPLGIPSLACRMAAQPMGAWGISFATCSGFTGSVAPWWQRFLLV